MIWATRCTNGLRKETNPVNHKRFIKLLMTSSSSRKHSNNAAIERPGLDDSCLQPWDIRCELTRSYPEFLERNDPSTSRPTPWLPARRLPVCTEIRACQGRGITQHGHASLGAKGGCRSESHSNGAGRQRPNLARAEVTVRCPCLEALSSNHDRSMRWVTCPEPRKVN